MFFRLDYQTDVGTQKVLPAKVFPTHKAYIHNSYTYTLNYNRRSSDRNAIIETLTCSDDVIQVQIIANLLRSTWCLRRRS